MNYFLHGITNQIFLDLAFFLDIYKCGDIIPSWKEQLLCMASNRSAIALDFAKPQQWSVTGFYRWGDRDSHSDGQSPLIKKPALISDPADYRDHNYNWIFLMRIHIIFFAGFLQWVAICQQKRLLRLITVHILAKMCKLLSEWWNMQPCCLGFNGYICRIDGHAVRMMWNSLFFANYCGVCPSLSICTYICIYIYIYIWRRL